MPADAMPRLRAKRVAIIGLEGPGAHAALQLAGSGVGALLLADPFPCAPGDLPLLPANYPAVVGQPRQAIARAALAAQGTYVELGPPELSRAPIDELVRGCDLLLCTFDRGFAAAHHWANRAGRAAGVAVLHAECTVHGALLGPLVLPGQGACYLCYRMRCVANAPDASAALAQEEALDRRRHPALHLSGTTPALAAYTGALLAREALHFLLGWPSPCAGAVLVLDAATLQPVAHPLLPVPACPVCGGAPHHPAQPPLASLHTAAPETDLLGLEARLVSSYTGVVRALWPGHRRDDDPPTPELCSAELANHRFERASLPAARVCGGKGFTPEAARRSALGEASERYSAGTWDARQIRYASAGALPGPALDPRALVLYAPEQYARLPFAPYTGANVLGWVPWRALISGAELFVPALATFLFYQPRAHQEHLFLNTSNGLASGPSLAAAVLGAACEVIERDAFVGTWLHRLPTQRINPLSHPDAQLRALCAAQARHGAEISLFRLPTDTPCQVFLALSLSERAGEPAAAVGLGADLQAAPAARKAVLEMAQVRASLRELVRQPVAQARAAMLAANPQFVVSPEDHALLYARRESLGALAFLLERPSEAYEWPRELPAAPADELELLVAHLRGQGGELLYRNLAPPDMLALGIYTARVVIPGYQPIDFGWGGTRLGGTRLYELPPRLGFAHTPTQLNPLPHPLA